MAYETIYQRASDEVARLSTITIETGTEPEGMDDYGPATLVDGNPAKVAKIDSTTGAWLFDFGAPQRIDLAALIHHNFDAGADVKIQGHTSDAWTSPDFSAAITIPAWLGSGTSRWPVNPWRDLTLASGYSASGFRYWRLVVTGNSQNLQLGHIWLGAQIRRLSPDVRWNYVPAVRKRIIEHRTSFDVSTIYTRGTNHWRFEGTVPADNALEAELEAHWYDVDGRSKPWLLIPQPPATSDQDVMSGRGNRAYLVRYLSVDRDVPHAMFNLHEQQIVVEEVSRGLRPGL
jgi:hypothetical protein